MDSGKLFSCVFLVMLFLALGAFLYHGVSTLESFNEKCDKLGGEVVSGRGPSLCVKDGLIVDHE